MLLSFKSTQNSIKDRIQKNELAGSRQKTSDQDSEDFVSKPRDSQVFTFPCQKVGPPWCHIQSGCRELEVPQANMTSTWKLRLREGVVRCIGISIDSLMGDDYLGLRWNSPPCYEAPIHHCQSGNSKSSPQISLGQPHNVCWSPKELVKRSCPLWVLDVQNPSLRRMI